MVVEEEMLLVVEVASPVFVEVESSVTFVVGLVLPDGVFPKKTDADISSSGGFACNASRIRVTVAEGGLVLLI